MELPVREDLDEPGLHGSNANDLDEPGSHGSNMKAVSTQAKDSEKDESDLEREDSVE